MSQFEEFLLSHGPLRFSARALGSGPTVILLHGFPDTLHSWREQMTFLADSGYRAVAVALRGYEPGSQPADGDYGAPTLASDVLAWIEELGGEPVHLVGHDWGAAIAYAAASAAPEKLLSLTTMAVPHSGRFLSQLHHHPRQLRLSWYMLFFQLRGIADHVVERRDFAFLRRLWRNWSPSWEFSDADFAPVQEAFRQPGVVKAALAYYRTALSPKSMAQTRAAGTSWQIDVPTLGITGAEEGCIAAEVFRAMMLEEDFPRGLKVVTVENAGHFPHREQPEEISSLLRAWLDQHGRT